MDKYNNINNAIDFSNDEKLKDLIKDIELILKCIPDKDYIFGIEIENNFLIIENISFDKIMSFDKTYHNLLKIKLLEQSKKCMCKNCIKNITELLCLIAYRFGMSEEELNNEIKKFEK